MDGQPFFCCLTKRKSGGHAYEKVKHAIPGLHHHESWSMVDRQQSLEVMLSLDFDHDRFRLELAHSGGGCQETLSLRPSVTERGEVTVEEHGRLRYVRTGTFQRRQVRCCSSDSYLLLKTETLEGWVSEIQDEEEVELRRFVCGGVFDGLAAPVYLGDGVYHFPQHFPSGRNRDSGHFIFNQEPLNCEVVKADQRLRLIATTLRWDDLEAAEGLTMETFATTWPLRKRDMFEDEAEP